MYEINFAGLFFKKATK